MIVTEWNDSFVMVSLLCIVPFSAAEQRREGYSSGTHLPEEKPEGFVIDEEYELLQDPVRRGRISKGPRGAAVWGSHIHIFFSSICLKRAPVYAFNLISQGVFVKSVTLYNNGDFSNSARNMEQAITLYFDLYDLCLVGCEGSYEIVEYKDFYATLAGEWRE